MGKLARDTLPLKSQVDSEGVDCRYGITAVVHSECGGGTTQLGSIAGVMLPCLQVLNVDIDFQGLQTYLCEQGSCRKSMPTVRYGYGRTCRLRYNTPNSGC